MVKSKSQSKKAQKRGVDFQKIKRKIGRKLPPPKNATNTEIKSKAIVLPEQSIASEKAGLALSKKGLTLKELLQQTNHHNAKVRKDALLGIKEILINHPAELKLHKFAVIEKVREKIGDDDKLVRETLYLLFKSVIFPGCVKDNQGPLVSSMMGYIFNAMTHLAIEVRLMAFKFVDLIVQFYPSSFPLYAEKIIHNYDDLLRKNQFLGDMSKLKNILGGLIRCLSLLPCNEREDHSTDKNGTPAHDMLHAFGPETTKKPIELIDIGKKLKGLLSILVGCFLDFVPLMHSNLQLNLQACDCMEFLLQSIDLIVGFEVGGIDRTSSDPHSQMPDMVYNHFISPMLLKKLWDVFPLNRVHHLSEKENDRIFMLNTVITKIFLQSSDLDYSPSALLDRLLVFIEGSLLTKVHSGKVYYEKHLLPLIPYIPQLAARIFGEWRSRILQAFTEVFKSCSPESSMKLACLAAIEEMLAPERSLPCVDASDPTLLDYQISWIRELPELLILLDDKHPLFSKAVLRLLLCIGQTSPVNSLFSQEFDSLQYSYRGFFSQKFENVIHYGPFMRLTADIQQLSICCLYYFSFMDSILLESLLSCCLCDDLEPNLAVNILEVLHSAFKAGHIEFADYISFHITLLARFQVYPEKVYPALTHDGKSNRSTFKHFSRIICSRLSEIGDDQLVFHMLENIVVDQICSEVPLDNNCAFLRLLLTLDPKATRLSDRSISNLSHVLPQYLISIISNVGDDNTESMYVVCAKRRRYYLLPSFCLFHGNSRLLNLVLNVMGSWISGDSLVVGSHHHTTMASAISSILLHMYEDDRMRQILFTCKIEIEKTLQNLLNLLSSESSELTLEEKHKIQIGYDRLRVYTGNGVLQLR